MADLLTTYDIRYNNSSLKKKVVSAVAKAANDVLNEDPGTSNHVARVNWAQSALANTPQAAEKMMWGIVQNATISADPDNAVDGDIQFVVNSLIDSIAINL